MELGWCDVRCEKAELQAREDQICPRAFVRGPLSPCPIWPVETFSTDATGAQSVLVGKRIVCLMYTFLDSEGVNTEDPSRCLDGSVLTDAVCSRAKLTNIRRTFKAILIIRFLNTKSVELV